MAESQVRKYRKQSLKEIWDENPIVLGLRNLQYKDFPKCNSCLHKQFCSICLIMNVNEDKKEIIVMLIHSYVRSQKSKKEVIGKKINGIILKIRIKYQQ